ncbi:SDR family oxidoreductase [Enterovirga rhinocerotis]|uniref:3-oxoacyl-[acyl-carrier protein] reductase n=1 Tax=Enterovirga rhinocerotis TaxID=1339210 RepID=A0A4R7C664_9HYPH|nr:SDR family oxidoreductase [Enterovirga rhinocerotis]TDR93412.1 3-oxoacyl-[acyl-carrier protein] reductase [Enterovirga rhinocerotis]
MDLGLTGKRALVLSSSRGLGRGIAESLAAEGANVVLTARSEDKLKAAADAINARGKGRASYIAADLAADVPGVHAKAVEALGGPIDILISNTGGPPAGTALSVKPEAWTPQFQAMVLPVFTLAGLVLPDMQKNGFGRIVIVASSGVIQPIPNLVMSNALRSSILGWAKTLSAEVAKDGITVNMILPGRIETDRTGELDEANAKRLGKTKDEVAAASVAQIPAGRYGEVREFGDVACFLASERAGYVTGSMIRVDGGATRSV